MAAAEREVTPDIEREIYKSQQRTEALKRYRDEREKERKVVEEKLSEVRESQLRLRDELEIANREVQEIEQRLDATVTAAGNWEKGYETTLVRLKQEMHASLAAIDSPNFEPAFSVVDQNPNSGSETRLQPESTVAFDPDGPVTQPYDTPGLVSGQAASCSDHPPPENRLSKTGRKEVDFDEVFQSGQAEEKYAIVEFPKASREWYILRCDEHNMRFGLNPISGAAKHINGDKHGHKKKEHKTAIKMLGIQVINCDAEKVERNNAVFQAEKSRDRLAMQQQGDGIASKKKGVMPRRRSGVSRRGSENPTEDNEWAAYDTYNWPGWRLEPDDDEPGSSDGGSGSLKAATAGPITNPVVGEVYQAFWPPTNEWFAAVLLTIGDFGDLGIDGSIATTGLLKDVPDCYEYDKLEKHIFGFKPGYRDGEPRVTKRWFPCMYLEERLPSPLDAAFGMRAILRADVLAWVPSQYLKPFVAQDTNITGRQLAAEWRERMKSLEGEGKNDSSNANTGTSKATSVDSAATTTDDETNNKVLVIDHPTGRLHNGEESGHSNENVNLRYPRGNLQKVSCEENTWFTSHAEGVSKADKKQR
ncbi:hypothetical protein GQ53DRAFT_765307 [Thozetella sp. PMI_491]|nr:hypothetical protein GQ53DRAFT_765307 [Thozetella sp. PMI_491]